jgi:CrcB protein
MVGTGVAGGLLTFSSFAYGTVVLMSGSAASVVVASAYVLSSLFLGCVAVVCGQQVARRSFR